MIVELVEESGESLGKFQSPAAPRRDETVSYDGERYVVEKVSWFVETDHDQHVKQIRIEVRRTDQ